MQPRFIPPLVLALACVFLAAPAVLHAQNATVEDYIDLNQLKSGGEDWEVVYSNLDPAQGRVSLYRNLWLMYFLHWRPLSQHPEPLTPEYVEHHLLNFWGDAMPFKLSGTSGETEVNGHHAYYVDGTIYDKISTRFVVWNCEETGRQFTSDCNINFSYGTPEKYLALENEMTHTVCCHTPCKPAEMDGSMPVFRSEEFNVSFVRPVEWTPHTFETKTWFPDGPSDTNGTLWTLPTNSELKIDLAWFPKEDELTDDVMKRLAQTLVLDSAAVVDTTAIIRHEVKSCVKDGRRFHATGTYDLLNTTGKEPYVDPYLFHAWIWNQGEQTRLLVVGDIHTTSVWNRPNDLTPDPSWFESWASDTAFQAVKGQ